MLSINRQFHYKIFSGITLFLTACTSSEIGDSKDVAQDKIYQTYNISYNENDEKLSATAVFRFAGSNGTTLVLNDPSKAALDDEVIKVDSSKFRGAYYEVAKAAAQWYGKHQWRFTDMAKKTYTNEFSFDAFKWNNPPASASKSKPLQLNFITPSLDPNDYVEVSTINSDSAFSYTQGPLTVKPFSVIIPAEYLQKQKQPILKLTATRVQYIRLNQNTAEGGEFIIRYSLKPIEVKLY
ncbi:MAG: hypothetical protein EKK37_07215 [Sphingobacteriales bacterium]|nr:MAG: hypothetical protein EKK37_07215 [Sphingobacteriales bacterium]